MTETRSVGHRFRARELPAEDVAAYVASKTRQVQAKVTGRIVVQAPATVVEERMGPWTQGSIEPLDEHSCRLQIGARSPQDIAFWIGVLDADFEVEDPPELADAVRRLSARYARAAPAPGSVAGERE